MAVQRNETAEGKDHNDTCNKALVAQPQVYTMVVRVVCSRVYSGSMVINMLYNHIFGSLEVTGSSPSATGVSLSFLEA